MKQSIAKIFKNLRLFLLLSIVTALISALFIFEQYHSYEKVNNLQQQKVATAKLFDYLYNTKAIDIIHFNSLTAELTLQLDFLHENLKYNILSNVILNNQSKYLTQLQLLQGLYQELRKNVKEHIEVKNNVSNTKSNLKVLESLHTKIVENIENIIIDNTSYDHQRFEIFYKIFLFLVLILIISSIWYSQRMKKIYDDIFFLYSIDSGKKNKEFFSKEIDAIALRMKRKFKVSDNPSMIDTITEINNYKGMVQEHLEKKNTNKQMFSSVTIFEIDNFSKSKRTYSEEFTHEILKKVAYTISLHEMASDIIARTDYNQFTVIFYRANKDQLFKDVDLVRQSIAELSMVTPDKVKIHLSVTGGFTYKNNNSLLDESIAKANDLLQKAKHIGLNRTLQEKDIPK